MVSLVGLVVLSPLLAVIALVILCTSKGGPLFVQARIGRGEVPFKCVKFRTMSKGAPVSGSHEVAGHWITPVGRRLRSLKLDEFPQLYNVLLGQMSLVGPRPCLPSQKDVIEARRKLGVFAIRPGITGRSQLASIDMSMPEFLAETDCKYLDTQTFAGDLGLILSTLIGRGRGDAAER